MEGELVLGKVERTQAGQYSVNAYNPRGAVNASFSLNVQCESHLYYHIIIIISFASII